MASNGEGSSFYKPPSDDKEVTLSSFTSDDDESENDESCEVLYKTCLESRENRKVYARQYDERKKSLKVKDDLIIELSNLLDSRSFENEFLKKVESTLREDLKNVTNEFENLKVEHERLKKTFSKFHVGTTSLNRLLESQIPQNRRFGIGFHSSNEFDSNVNQIIQEPIERREIDLPESSSTYACKHCKMNDHKTHKCLVKGKGLPEGNYKWVAKGTTPKTNQKGPNITWVPSSSH